MVERGIVEERPIMDRIERLNSREDAELQAAAERYVKTCGGNVMKALKTMMLLNRDLQADLEASKAAPQHDHARHPAAKPAQQRFRF